MVTNSLSGIQSNLQINAVIQLQRCLHGDTQLFRHKSDLAINAVTQLQHCVRW